MLLMNLALSSRLLTTVNKDYQQVDSRKSRKCKLLTLKNYRDQWKLEGGKGYFFTRNNSTLVAFSVGLKATSDGVSLFKIIGCHTDSPVLKLSPVTKLADRVGF